MGVLCLKKALKESVVDLIQKVEDVKRLTPPELKVYLELLEHLVKKMRGR